MYIILSQSNNDRHTYKNALGHEIHISRFILLDMLNKSLINNNDTIVIANIERSFLYSKLFKYIIEYDEFVKKNINENDYIDLSIFSYIHSINFDEVTKFQKKINYPLYDYIKETIPFTRNFDNLINSIEYNTLNISKKFILIHHRYVNKIQLYHNINREKDILNTKELILRLQKYYPDTDIIIFTSLDNLDINIKNIKYINTLYDYASHLNHALCIGTISEWSGAGQLSQYCHNRKIIYFFHHYISNNYHLQKNEIEKHANNNTLYYAFDFHKTTDAKIIMYENISNILENISNILENINNIFIE
jgi:hypothetical protein